MQHVLIKMLVISVRKLMNLKIRNSLLELSNYKMIRRLTKNLIKNLVIPPQLKIAMLHLLEAVQDM